MLTVEVLGTGCPKCKKLEELARSAMVEMAIEADVQKVTDIASIMDYDVLATPGLVINETVVSSGRLPSVAEITTWLADAMAAADES
jgi:small redox-active disulfide protein 2